MGARSTTSVFSKLTPEKKDALLPKIMDVYDKVDDTKKLKIFLSVIVQRCSMEVYFQALFIDILHQLLIKNNKDIKEHEFKQCVSTLCQNHFEKHLSKDFKMTDERLPFITIATLRMNRKRSLISITKFIGKLAVNLF